MTPDALRDLSVLPSFPRTAHELIHVAGLEATALLITAWRGQEFPVPQRTRNTTLGERRFAQLEEIVGGHAARRIVAHWGGQRLCIPNCKEALWEREQDFIRADYDHLTGPLGYSHGEAIFELGLKYDVSGRCVELVLKRPDNPGAPGAVQGCLF